MNYRTYIFLVTILLLNCITQAQNIIQGVIIDKKTKELLIGANIIIENNKQGAISDIDGVFIITYNELPITLECSYIGYKNNSLTITENSQDVTIMLSKDKLILNNINVTDTRLSEKLKQSPVTIESMDIIAIKETPAASFYEGLGNLKGIDLTSASLGFKIINTRGFNSTSPVRSLQIIDGVDNQSPGLNFSLGNFLGTTELDTKGVEIIVGANSALYGPNAFNGVISMSTKDPFMFPGTSYQIKIGERSLTEHCFRYAANKRLTKNGKETDYEIGFKINIQKMQANDWEANNIDASYDTESNVNNPGGYDAVNIYGDEFNKEASFNDFPGMGTVHRTGYAEGVLADYNTENFKFNTAIHLKKKDREFIYGFNFGSGTTIYQGDNRYSLKNIQFWQNKIEYRKKDDFFIRFYTTHEDAGDSYDIVSTAQELTNKSANNGEWLWDANPSGGGYGTYWQEEIINLMESNIDGFINQDEWQLQNNGSIEGWQESMQNILNQYPDLLAQYHELARNQADNNLGEWAYSYLDPESDGFKIEFDNITSNTRFDQYGNLIGGTQFYDKSSLYHIQVEKKFDTKYGLFTIGANGRLYKPDSQGSIFNDGFDYIQTPELNEQGDTVYVEMLSGEWLFENGTLVPEIITGPSMLTDTIKVNIKNYEFGAYLGYDKQFLGETLLFNATARIDKNENFDYLFSPAASMVYKPNERDIIRLSLSSAIRNPTLTDQYLDYNAGPATLIGNLNGFGYDEYFVTIDAMLDCLAADNTSLGNSNGAALRNGKLEIKPITPEEVKTIEVGFRTTLLNKVYIDASYYYSIYNNFIGYQFGSTYSTSGLNTITSTQEDVDLGWAEYIGQEIDDYKAIVSSTTQFWRVSANAADKVKTQGFSIGMNYYMTEKIGINGNYSWNKLINENTSDPLVPAFNTPEHKFNIGFSNKFSLSAKQKKHYHISINYKWIKGFLFEGSPQFTGMIPSYGMIDTQINRDYKINTGILTAKVGVSNLLNNKVYQVYGGPRIGRLAYFSLTMNID
jgi:iron complex outermembrane receptor protein